MAAAFADDRATPEAGILLFERRRGPFRTVDLPPFLPYTSVLTADPHRESDVHHRRSALEALCPLLAETYDEIRLQLPPRFADVRLFQWAGWNAEPRYTYRLAVPDADSTEGPPGDASRWSGSTRRLYENEREAFTLETDPGGATRVIDLAAESYRRHGRSLPGPGSNALRSLVEELLEAGLVRVAAARETDTGEVAAGCVLLVGKRTDYYWIAGSRPGPAMTVLLGALVRGELPTVREGREREEGEAVSGPASVNDAGNPPLGRTLDLVGANTPSIAEFKRKFGGRLTPYYRVSTRPSLLLEALARLRRRSRPAP